MTGFTLRTDDRTLADCKLRFDRSLPFIAPSRSAIRDDVVREALTWEGTPYHSHARLKGIGVDCAQLPMMVYASVGLMVAEHIAYSSQSMLHQDEEHYIAVVSRLAREITRAELLPGDFVIWKFGRSYSHGAIVIDLPEVLHAAVREGAVVRANIDRDEELRERPARYFSPFQ